MWLVPFYSDLNLNITITFLLLILPLFYFHARTFLHNTYKYVKCLFPVSPHTPPPCDASSNLVLLSTELYYRTVSNTEQVLNKYLLK